MRVMHILTTRNYSGAENVACQIIKMLDDQIDFIYCSPSGKIAETLDKKGIKYFPLFKFSLFELKKAIIKIKPDIIHAHDGKASVFAAMLKPRKALLIAHIHYNAPKNQHITTKTLLMRLTQKKYDKMIFVSNSCLEGYQFKDKINEKSKILYNAIDINNIWEMAKADNNNYNYDLVFLGRLTDQKDPLRFINLIKQIKAKYVSIRVAVIGDGSLMEQCQKKVIEYNLNDSIDFKGFMANPYKILQQAKALVLTSKYEGTPMVVLEALALNIPILSTPTDGVVDVIRDGLNGFLADSDELLCEKAIYIINHTNEIKEKAKETKLIINDAEQYKDEIFRIYSEVGRKNHK